MTRTTNTNYTAADATLGDIAFQVADSDNDLFDRFDVAKLAKAVDVHTHNGTGKGLVTAALSQAVGTAQTNGQTTTSLTFVDVDATNLSVTITPISSTSIIFVLVEGSCRNDTATKYVAFAIYQDNVSQGDYIWTVQIPTAGGYGSFGGGQLLTGTAGVPTTIRLRWLVEAGTGTLNRGRIAVVELKK